METFNQLITIILELDLACNSGCLGLNPTRCWIFSFTVSGLLSWLSGSEPHWMVIFFHCKQVSTGYSLSLLYYYLFIGMTEILIKGLKNYKSSIFQFMASVSLIFYNVKIFLYELYRHMSQMCVKWVKCFGVFWTSFCIS